MAGVPEIQIPRARTHYTYRCKYCGWENRKSGILGNPVPVTKRGDYGSNATPTPTTFADEMYDEATTVSFVTAGGLTPATIADSAALFSDKHFTQGMTIRVVTTSGTNDGDYTIAGKGVTASEILLSSNDSLTTESAATAGAVTISRVIYKPNITTGCPFCGNLNSR